MKLKAICLLVACEPTDSSQPPDMLTMPWPCPFSVGIGATPMSLLHCGHGLAPPWGCAQSPTTQLPSRSIPSLL